MALFITESLKHRKAPRDHRGHGTSFGRPLGTLRGFPRDVSVVATASRHLGNTEKAPVTSPQVFPGQRSSVEDDEPTIPHDAKGSLKQTLRCTKGNRRPGTLNSTPNVRTRQNRLSRRRVAQTFAHATNGDIRLIQILFVQAFQIYKLIGHRRSDFSYLEPPIIPFCPHKESGPETGNRAHPSPPLVPFRSTTLASRAIAFKGFLTTLTLPREEVVTIRGLIHRAQSPFHLFFLYRVLFPLPCIDSLFRVHLGFGTFGTTRGRLDPSLRSPTSPIPHRVVAKASVPTHFPETVAAAPLSGHSTRSSDPSLATPTAASPTLFLLQ
ncbi:hypothetical protein CRG98_011154 [Punica granatum]|uniref:Uncharacterized protein n=1 Tax=Punica granatum TaxID=22663 RepID=A0A2I0KIX2_PUNGR|nr:hypothetical protein CRG98_011154 [Punica granatum]